MIKGIMAWRAAWEMLTPVAGRRDKGDAIAAIRRSGLL